jgi:hypothetical protein
VEIGRSTRDESYKHGKDDITGQVEAGTEVMRQYRNTLRKLAE